MMALISCKDCAREYSSDAKRCLQCGAKKPPKDRSTIYKVFAGLFILSGILQVLTAQDHGSIEPPVAKAGPSPAVICDVAQEAVKQVLSAPATAVFPTCFMDIREYDIRESDDNKKIKIDGHVDAQNGFGALLRKNWTVVLKKDANEASGYAVSYVVLEGKRIPFHQK